jgi:hypothetical protein
MIHESLLTQGWEDFVGRLGGEDALRTSAKDTKAFLRPRGIRSPLDMLRMILAYCLGDCGLRTTSSWAASIGLADVANTALLYRLRQSEKWLRTLVEQALTNITPRLNGGRLIRIVDGTSVPQAGTAAKTTNKLWRIHSAFSLPAERFDYFELTDESAGETLDRIPVIRGEIRVGDRAFAQPDRMAAVIEAGADIVVRAGWRKLRWLEVGGEPLDFLGELERGAAEGLIDRPVWIGRKNGLALRLRLIAVKKPPEAAEASRRKARRDAQREGYTVSQGTLVSADWVILVTSLSREAYPAADVLALYRLRWRIELAFKRLKSIIGLKAPPGIDERSAKPYVLAHLLILLILEPLVREFEVSPRLVAAA